MNRRRLRPAVLLAMVLVAGCGGAGGLDTAAAPSSPSGPAATTTSPAPTPTPSSTPSTSASVDPGAAVEVAVAADYRRYDRAFTKALFARSTRVADLTRFSTALRGAAVRSRIATMHQRGIVYRGTPQNWVGPVSIVGDRATVQICEKDDASWYAYSSTGQPVGTKLDKWDAFDVRVLKRGGRWQVDLVTASKKISCKDAR